MAIKFFLSENKNKRTTKLLINITIATFYNIYKVFSLEETLVSLQSKTCFQKFNSVGSYLH